jgi:hypothetical protein
MDIPAAPPSNHLGPRHLQALEAIGDALIPGDEYLPSFSRLGCVVHVDRLLDQMPREDLRQLKGVLAAFSLLPRPVVAVLLRWLEAELWPPGPWAPPLRYLRLGLRGMVVSLYYSGRAGPAFEGRGPLNVLSYHVGVVVDDAGPAAPENELARADHG